MQVGTIHERIQKWNVSLGRPNDRDDDDDADSPLYKLALAEERGHPLRSFARVQTLAAERSIVAAFDEAAVPHGRQLIKLSHVVLPFAGHCDRTPAHGEERFVLAFLGGRSAHVTVDVRQQLTMWVGTTGVIGTHVCLAYWMRRHAALFAPVRRRARRQTTVVSWLDVWLETTARVLAQSVRRGARATTMTTTTVAERCLHVTQFGLAMLAAMVFTGSLLMQCMASEETVIGTLAELNATGWPIVTNHVFGTTVAWLRQKCVWTDGFSVGGRKFGRMQLYEFGACCRQLKRSESDVSN